MEKQPIPSDALSIFNEATICFKVGAYRASLLLSYLSFLLTVRARLKGAVAVPTGIPMGKWTTLLNDLSDDSEWDPAAYDATQTTQPAAYFLVPQDHRKQVEYWRARRNDCAHGKSNIITEAHVESFWLFLRSTLGHWVANGSSAALIQEFQKHFDPVVTPPGTDYGPLVEKIGGAVPMAELAKFFTDLEACVAVPQGPLTPLHVFDRIFGSYSAVPNITASLATHIAASPNTLVAFLTMHLNRIGFFGGNPVRIRKLWYSDIHTQLWPKLPIFVALLRNGLIPETEQAEALQRLVAEYGFDVPSAADLVVLQPLGFVDLLRQRLVSAMGNFHWANSRAQVFVWLVHTFPLDLELVKALSANFDSTYHSYDVATSLNQYFANTPAKKAEFRALADAHHVLVPAHIPALA